jgi:hypothetical protein
MLASRRSATLDDSGTASRDELHCWRIGPLTPAPGPPPAALLLGTPSGPLACLGEETWSSGRAPASNHALCAYTPSHGVISLRGNWPLVPTMDVVVPHARTMTDLLEQPPGWRRAQRLVVR